MTPYQSVELTTFLHVRLAHSDGLEPSTLRVTAEYSAAELRVNMIGRSPATFRVMTGVATL